MPSGVRIDKIIVRYKEDSKETEYVKYISEELIAKFGLEYFQVMYPGVTIVPLPPMTKECQPNA